MTAKRDWTDEEDATAREMWRGGFTASQIGKKLDRSRNSIISRMHKGTYKYAKRRPRKPRSFKIAPPKKKAPVKPIKVHKMETLFPEPVSLRVSLVDARDDQCRFIASDPRAGEVTFCGHLVKPQSSYCPHHHARVWVKPENRERGERVQIRQSILTGIAA